MGRGSGQTERTTLPMRPGAITRQVLPIGPRTKIEVYERMYTLQFTVTADGAGWTALMNIVVTAAPRATLMRIATPERGDGACVAEAADCGAHCDHGVALAEIELRDDMSERIAAQRARWSLAHRGAYADWRFPPYDRFWVARLADDITVVHGSRGDSGHGCVLEGNRCRQEHELEVCVERAVAFDSAAVGLPALLATPRHALVLAERLRAGKEAPLPGTERAALSIVGGDLLTVSARRLTLPLRDLALGRCQLCARGDACPHADIRAFAALLGGR